ncbi:argininosuccinate lyase [Deinobacterium chartae]|uniref:Argininosuccinate lyase n=1 Tax=Deinobacterium chartae TaxID=521158 RepID=A0A841I3D1_9DEIO|nr:argininosuccinate lyase [Deinobacterium chartae]MBB6098425.1 argininosuccinate lyase [Deinobacterium chartae]
MNWNPTYLECVLEPDYQHARSYLLPQLFDALTAHALGLERMGVPGASRAVSALRELRHTPIPDYDPAVEDVFFAVDRLLAAVSEQAIGALRTALSRNDLDMTIYRLAARERLLDLEGRVETLRRVLLDLAQEHLETIMVAFTHHQPAQPTTLAHYLAGLENVLSRDTARLQDLMGRLNLSPLGAVALGGTSHPIDRHYTAQLLAFDRPIENTYDAVSASDWQVEIAGTASVIATDLSRGLHDLLFWASTGLVSIGDGLVQSSSVMPQKRNPVALEHARTKFSKALGYAQAISYSAHNVPFGDINDPGPDMQEPLRLLWEELDGGLKLLTASLETLTVDRERWLEQAENGDTLLTELADTLSRELKLGFREAHAHGKKLLKTLRDAQRMLRDANSRDLEALGLEVSDAAVRAALDAHEFVARRKTLGGPAPEVVAAHLEQARERLEHDAARRLERRAAFAAARTRLSSEGS